MTTEAAPTVRPNVESRRRQILDAASLCARRAGFHGARMSEIAQAAGLSVGQIYRYFESKEAIIGALIAQDVVDKRGRFAELERSGEPLGEAIVNGCSQAMDGGYGSERTALMLEVLAEASRNPQAAAVLRAADQSQRAFLLEVMRQVAPPGCTDRELAARSEVLGMLFEGMAVRAVANPDSDRVAICAVVQSLLRRLISDPPGGLEDDENPVKKRH
ncbi:TetR/AcrR family transcriptional regulator [Phenylobacterium sp.]|uniref:TetR/AcrR family transcriptional regulator n=1 Tax=Phenylobacterium sp. TaxID=1871053 RepID=UPI002F422C19